MRQRSLKAAVRRSRSISDLLARDSIRQMVDAFIEKDLPGATALILIWRGKQGDVCIAYSDLCMIEAAGMLEVGKSILLTQEEDGE